MPPKKNMKREIIDLTAEEDDVIDLTQDEEMATSDTGQGTNPHNKPNQQRITFQEIRDPKPPDALLEMFRVEEEQSDCVVKKNNYILVHILWY